MQQHQIPQAGTCYAIHNVVIAEGQPQSRCRKSRKPISIKASSMGSLLTADILEGALDTTAPHLPNTALPHLSDPLQILECLCCNGRDIVLEDRRCKKIYSRRIPPDPRIRRLRMFSRFFLVFEIPLVFKMVVIWGNVFSQSL